MFLPHDHTNFEKHEKKYSLQLLRKQNKWNSVPIETAINLARMDHIPTKKMRFVFQNEYVEAARNDTEPAYTKNILNEFAFKTYAFVRKKSYTWKIQGINELSWNGFFTTRKIIWYISSQSTINVRSAGLSSYEGGANASTW